MNNLDFSQVNWEEFGKATVETLQMLAYSSLFTLILGLPIGIILFLTSRSSSVGLRLFYSILSIVVNILRSVPFIILIIALIPVTKEIVHTSIGVRGMIPPLVIGAAPFYARLVETSLREVDRGVIEAAQAMGASTWQVVYKVILRESRPGLIAGFTVTVIALISYTAMSGLVGGGGLGFLAVNYGYYRYETAVMLVSIVIIILLVQLIQMIGDRLVIHFTRK
ncbi:methionine ABC transporter permease [Saccharibacillus sp. CPCC 101409]|uniref:methionine ABC transporter permease n=1 Tax=Saccharibacillus sp. CPCC 101409 TaxID=3058041 RepID=UPI002671CC0A|nr:methionine ABC transporter permease [Saccharibacillus sp. CPCC 101409]MDO3411018.1 methionine ABC transporter permease [Saccharibacillus sp. CPCC 101409]